MFNRLRFPATLFFVASLLGLLQLYYAIGGNGWRLSLSALAYGLLLGSAIQSCFRQPVPKLRVGIASFFGAFVLWIPVILVTFGLALAATPVFMAYGVTVVLGTWVASHWRKPGPKEGAA